MAARRRLGERPRRGATVLIALALAFSGAWGAGCSSDGGSSSDPTSDAGDTSAPARDVASDTGDAESDVADRHDTGRTDGSDAAPDASADPCDAPRSIPDGAVELSWFDGESARTVRDLGWEVAGARVDRAVAHEAIRFELEHPARVYGFSVRYGHLPEVDASGGGVVEAGLYPDFGHNGFDFWAPDPLWTGSRCREAIEQGAWVDYVFDEPIALDHPGLVYVAHRRDGEDAPAWLMDDTAVGEGDCAAWGDCHSGINLPEEGDFYNGTSFPIPYDYHVKLYVEWTEQLDPEEAIFQRVPGVEVSNRMAWGDYDNDGWEDLFSGGSLYRNRGDGGFDDVTEASGIAALNVPSHGGVWGDYDGDGCDDLIVFAESLRRGEMLLRNRCDGTFEDVTEAAGIDDRQDDNDCGDPANVHAPTTAAAWWDWDGDGDLDLYLANMICWDDYTFYVDDVWRNEGDGTFVSWKGLDGFRPDARSGRGAHPVDYDQDGDVDLFVNNYTLHANLLFRTTSTGLVREEAEEYGAAGHASERGASTYFGHSIGAAWGDLDVDGDFDLVVANLAHPRFFDFSDKTQILLNDGRGFFDDIQGDWSYPAGAAGLRFQETHSVPVLADFDLDGVLDLAISAVYVGRPTDFYWGNGDGTFRLDAYRAGIDVTNGWGMATADFDGDGDLDLAAKGALFENTLDAAESGQHWIQLRPRSRTSANPGALGATVRAYVGETVYLRHVVGGSGQGCQDSQMPHVGLGEVDAVDRVEVDFADGQTIAFDGPFEADRRWWLFDDGTAVSGWEPPAP